MSKRARYLQLFLEALIPLMGFFFWDWSLYFILLFYFLDLIAEETMMHVKENALHKYLSRVAGRKLILPLMSILTLLTAVFIIHLAMSMIDPEINFRNEVARFWNYRELGLPQGYILAPLVAFAAYQRYRIEFIMLKGYERVTITTLWKGHIRNQLMILSGSGIVLGLSGFIIFDEIYYVIAIVAGIATVKQFVLK